jgi:hypothetical protein
MEKKGQIYQDQRINGSDFHETGTFTGPLKNKSPNSVSVCQKEAVFDRRSLVSRHPSGMRLQEG